MIISDEHMNYARGCAKHWMIRHPMLEQEIMSVTMLQLVKVEQKQPLHFKGYLSAAVRNAVAELINRNNLIYIPDQEFRRRREAKLSTDDLPKVRLVDEELYNIPRQQPPPWMPIYITELRALLELSGYEERLLDLRLEGYSLSEISERLKKSKSTLHETLQNIRGRYLRLRHTHRGIL